MADNDDNTTTNSLHILMFPFLAFGHIIPFLQLSRKLSSAGIKISFLSTPANLPRIQSLLPSSSTIQLISLPLPSVPGLPAGAESTADLPLETSELLKIALDNMRPQVARLIAELRPELVFFDFSQPWVPSIAHPLGVKTLLFSVFSASGIAYLIVPSRRHRADDNAAGELIRPPAGFPASTALSGGVPAYQAANLTYVFEIFGDSSVYDRFLAGLTGCSAVVLKTCMEMESPYVDYIQSQIAKPILLAGPVVPEPPVGSLGPEWAGFLDRFPDRSVVFCCFGSEATLDEEVAKELLLGLEMAGKPFLAVLKGQEWFSGGESLVSGGWAPQQLILRHRSVGCFVGHAGMSSLVEGVVSGCRTVMLPHTGDQFLNATRYVGDLGIGVEVERLEDGGFSKEAVRDAVIKAMEQNEKERSDVWRRFLLDGEVQERFLRELIGKLKELSYDKLSK